MKRQAENQITKDGDDGNSSDEGGGELGMKKAPEAELVRRTIRPLPTRNKPQVQPAFTAPSATTSEPSAFSNANPFGLKSDTLGGAIPSPSSFTGFGIKSTAPDATNSGTSATSNTFSLSASSPFSSFTSKPPSFAPTATVKAFASILSNSSASPFGSPPAPVPPPTTSPGKTVEESDTVKYYKNLRGLNASLLSSLSKFVQDDPYVDLTEALEKYKAFRTKVQADFGDSSTSSKPSSQPPPPSSTAPPTSEKPAMPAPPPTFAGFGGFKLPAPAASSPPSSSTAPSSSGSSSLGFKPTPSVFGSSTTPSAFTLPTESKSSGFTFGASTSSSTAPAHAAPAPSFGFGSSSSSSSTPSTSLFGSFGSNTTASQPSAALSNPFGLSSSSTSGFAFGKSTEKSESSTSNPFGVSEKSTSASSSFFSVPSSSKPTPSGATFGFGSSSSSSTSASVFGKSEPKASMDDTATEGEGSERDTPAAEESTTPLLGANPLDEEGAGEENEDTVHAIKAKAFKLSKDAEGAAKWLQLGTGIMRLKKDKETDSRRILLRNSTNGKVIVNFNIYAGLKPTQNKSALSFIGHEDGAPVTYSIRLANEVDAKTLKEALDREIAIVKAK